MTVTMGSVSPVISADSNMSREYDTVVKEFSVRPSTDEEDLKEVGPRLDSALAQDKSATVNLLRNPGTIFRGTDGAEAVNAIEPGSYYPSSSAEQIMNDGFPMGLSHAGGNSLFLR